MLKIVKSSIDGVTGHISMDCCIVEKEGNSTTEGPVETKGIHPAALDAQYNGNVEEWVESHHRSMLAQHRNRKAAAIHLVHLQALGKTILLDEEKQNGSETQT